jgi:hypothetical protein
MKKLLIVIALLLAGCAPNAAEAWTLTWEAVPGAEGYRVTYDTTTVDVGTNLSLDLDTLGLTEGQRYEVYVQGYAGTPPSYSAHSNHLRWTYPSAPVVIEMMGSPVNILITP